MCLFPFDGRLLSALAHSRVLCKVVSQLFNADDIRVALAKRFDHYVASGALLPPFHPSLNVKIVKLGEIGRVISLVNHVGPVSDIIVFYGLNLFVNVEAGSQIVVLVPLLSGDRVSYK